MYQPWASLMLGPKRYETRSWWTPYRGPLLIHAAKTKDWLTACDDPAITEALRSLGLTRETLPLGAIVARGDLVAMHRVEDLAPDAFGDYTPGRYAWEYANAVKVDPPIPARGYQQMWDFQHELIAEAPAWGQLTLL